MTTDRLHGPIRNNPSEGPFWNLEQWSLAGQEGRS